MTAAVYAIADVAKFQGYALAENTPLSNWRGGSFGLVDFSVIFDDPGLYTFYVVRTFISIVINISSVLLVLIDTVCLQVRVREQHHEEFSISRCIYRCKETAHP